MEEAEKMLQHKVNIAVKQTGVKEQVTLKAAEKKIHKRFLNWLLGDEMNILVVTPGPSVRTVEIQELVQSEEAKERSGK